MFFKMMLFYNISLFVLFFFDTALQLDVKKLDLFEGKYILFDSNIIRLILISVINLYSTLYNYIHEYFNPLPFRFCFLHNIKNSNKMTMMTDNLRIFCKYKNEA